MDQVLNTLTVDDLIRIGACHDGVLKFHKQNFPTDTAVAVEDALVACRREDEAYFVLKAAALDGFCDGYGGDGGGNGYGDLDGGGDGYGDRDGGGGYGDGYGGYGYGDVDGDGYGNVDGYGYGSDGYGYGYGYGYGDGGHNDGETK